MSNSRDRLLRPQPTANPFSSGRFSCISSLVTVQSFASYRSLIFRSPVSNTISPGLLRFRSFPWADRTRLARALKPGHGAHAAGYLSPRPPVLRGVTTKSTHRLPHFEQLSRLAQSGTARSAPCRSACSPGSISTLMAAVLAPDAQQEVRPWPWCRASPDRDCAFRCRRRAAARVNRQSRGGAVQCRRLSTRRAGH